MIEIIIDTNSAEIIFPITPEEIEITTPGNNESINIIGLGEVKILRKPGLSTFRIESFIPDYDDGEEFKDNINSWWGSETPGDFNAGELGINMSVCVDDFVYIRRAGEEDKLYYTLSLSEYRPYGAKIITQMPDVTSIIGTAAIVAASIVSGIARVNNSDPVQSTYTTITGDGVWKIAAQLGGSKGTNWNELYEVNKAAIGNSPNAIAAGKVLTIPQSWIT